MSHSKEEKRKLLREWSAQQREKAEKALPTTKETLLKLFDHLDQHLVQEACDHTLRLTRAWATAQGLDADRIVDWTREHGGFCDCEVLVNVESSNPALNRG